MMTRVFAFCIHTVPFVVKTLQSVVKTAKSVMKNGVFVLEDVVAQCKGFYTDFTLQKLFV